MPEPKYGFHFADPGLSLQVGAVSPAEEHFEGSNKEESLVREICQNSIDATRGHLTRMEFELLDVPTASIPDVHTLRYHLEVAVKSTDGSRGHEYMKNALAVLSAESVPVLRISDFGTSGLTGDESINAKQSALVALTRGAGISADDKNRGGSFGIGSSSYTMMSDARTVFYSTLPHDRDQIVTTAHSRLATHTDGGDHFGADGFFTDTSDLSDFSYMRGPSPFSMFSPREEPGTDIFIIGYRMAEEDPNLEFIRDALISNFMVAVHRNTLEISASTSAESWVLNAKTLPGFVRNSDAHSAFFTALSDPEPYVATTKNLGELKLYVNLDNDLEKSLYTMTIRTPLMKIETYRHVIASKYAAILDCSNSTANPILRDLESPTHRSWDPGRAPHGKKLVAELKTFIRQGLAAKVGDRYEEVMEITGLDRYLPTGFNETAKQSEVGVGDPTDTETSSVSGAESSSSQTPQRRKSVRVSVRNPATGSGDSPVTKGKDTGGEGTRSGGGTGLPGKGKEGDGKSRISGDAIRFRSWSAPSGEVFVALHSQADISGDIELAALGPGGEVEPDFPLPIEAVFLSTDSGQVDVAFSGNVLRDVQIPSSTDPTILKLRLRGRRRFRLGVI